MPLRDAPVGKAWAKEAYIDEVPEGAEDYAKLKESKELTKGKNPKIIVERDGKVYTAVLMPPWVGNDGKTRQKIQYYERKGGK